MPVVGIYFGYSGISVSYIRGTDLVNLDVFGDGFTYPIFHAGKESYARNAFNGLFSDSSMIVSNLMYLLSKDELSKSDMYLYPFSVRKNAQGEFSISAQNLPVSQLIGKLLLHIYTVVTSRVGSKENMYVFSFPMTLPDAVQDRIINIAESCGYEYIERLDCLTCYAVFKNIEYIDYGKQETRLVTFLVVDEHEVYCTSAVVDCIPGRATSSTSFRKLKDIYNLSITIESLVLSIRNYLVKSYFLKILQQENILSVTDSQYTLLNQQLYVYLAVSLSQFTPGYHFTDLAYCINNHWRRLDGASIGKVCVKFISTYVKTCISDMMKWNNYDPNRHVYVVGDFANLFSVSNNVQYNSVQEDITSVLASFSYGAACCCTQKPIDKDSPTTVIYSFITELT